MKIETGTTMKTTGCHHWRVTNSSGSPTAVRQASSAPSASRSPLIQSRSGLELRATFFTPAASAMSTHAHEKSAITCACSSDMRWYREKIPTVPTEMISAETTSKTRYARK